MDNSNKESLIKRVRIFLQDGEWEKAKEYCERVLDLDPENYEAYLCQLLAEVRISDMNALADVAIPIDTIDAYKKAIRFAGDEEKEKLIQINKENYYRRGLAEFKKAKTEKEYYSAKSLFDSISDYKDAESLSVSCSEKAVEVMKKAEEIKKAKTKKIVIAVSISVVSIITILIIWVIVQTNTSKNRAAIITENLQGMEMGGSDSDTSLYGTGIGYTSGSIYKYSFNSNGKGVESVKYYTRWEEKAHEYGSKDKDETYTNDFTYSVDVSLNGDVTLYINSREYRLEVNENDKPISFYRNGVKYSPSYW